MKVAFISQPGSHAYLPAQKGAIQIWIYEVAFRLAKSCDVIVYASRGRHQARNEVDLGVEYRRISSFVDQWLSKILRLVDLLKLTNIRRPLFSSVFWYMGYGIQVARDLKNQGCDIVHIMNFSQLVPVIKYFNPNVKIVLHMHCEWLSQLDPVMINQRLRHVDQIIGCSEYVTNTIREGLPAVARSVETIYNGVDTGHFTCNLQKPELNNNGVKHLLYVGRISPEKGIHVLIKAFEKVLKSFPDVQLYILGHEARASMSFIDPMQEDEMVTALEPYYRGSYLAHLKSLVSTNISESVTFLGHIPHREILRHLHQADILVNPSIRETFGMSLIESMATGTPVVASQIGGMAHIIVNHHSENATGILVERGNVDALSEAIIQLLQSDRLRAEMGTAGYHRARALYSWDPISENVYRLYQEMQKV